MRKIPATDNLSIMLKVLSDPTRLAIFDLLMQGIQCNCELGDKLDLPMNLISHHLKALKDVGLVGTERDAFDARWVYYSIDLERLEQLRDQLNAFLDPARIQPRLPTCGPQIIPVETRHVGGG